MEAPVQCEELAVWLQKRIPQDSLVLDVGCGTKWYWPFLPQTTLIGVDGWETFKPHICMDFGKEPLPFADRSFDIVLCLDVIEHLERGDGETLLKELVRVAKKKVVLLTPLVWDTNEKAILEPGPHQGNPLNLHRSLWGLDDFAAWHRFHLTFTQEGNYFLGEYRKSERGF